MALIEIKNLIKTYQTGDTSFNALDDVWLSIDGGELLARWEERGVGKECEEPCIV